jgi:hypothetical protein
LIEQFKTSAPSVGQELAAAPAEERRQREQTVAQLLARQITGEQIFLALSKLRGRLPSFSPPTFNALEKQLIALTRANCTNCSRNSLYGQLHQLIVHEYEKNNAEFQKVWAEVFPYHNTLVIRGDIKVREGS